MKAASPSCDAEARAHLRYFHRNLVSFLALACRLMTNGQPMLIVPGCDELGNTGLPEYGAADCSPPRRVSGQRHLRPNQGCDLRLVNPDYGRLYVGGGGHWGNIEC